MSCNLHPVSLSLLVAGLAAVDVTPPVTGSRLPTTFQDDQAFLAKAQVELVTLSDADGSAQVLVSPRWQGRVLTSTASGPTGPSLGWINRDLIATGTVQEHINAYGGEDRFWLGPEGGQFSLFFAPGASFDLAHWQTPPAIDTVPYPVVSQERDRVACRYACTLRNYSGTVFALTIDRAVRLLDRTAMPPYLGMAVPAGVQVVAYESDNRITNAGTTAWSKATGLLSIWILGMYPPTPGTVVVVPFVTGSEARLGPAVNDAYFGRIAPDRLVVRDGVAFFKADGNRRGKIGIAPARCKPVLGSYDAINRILTIVQFSVDAAQRDYVNSAWCIQDRPFAGDVANSYNDGPPAPGAKPLGPFYELESSSPAVALAPGQMLTHIHRTLHLTGDQTGLDTVARAVLGVSLADIAAALP